MARGESGECCSISISGCGWITVLVDLICTFLVGRVFCVTGGLVVLVTNTRVVFSTARAAVVF